MSTGGTSHLVIIDVSVGRSRKSNPQPLDKECSRRSIQHRVHVFVVSSIHCQCCIAKVSLATIHSKTLYSIFGKMSVGDAISSGSEVRRCAGGEAEEPYWLRSAADEECIPTAPWTVYSDTGRASYWTVTDTRCCQCFESSAVSISLIDSVAQCQKVHISSEMFVSAAVRTPFDVVCV